MTTGYKEFNRYVTLMDKVNMLEDAYTTAVAEDDRWTANKCLIELKEINEELDKLEQEQ